MTDVPDPIIRSLKSDLKSILNFEKDPISRSKKSIDRIRESCKEMSLWKHTYEFQNVKDEIHFIKNVKVQIYSLLFYHTDILNFHSQKPNGDDRIKRVYIREHLHRIHDHSNCHKGLYQYHRIGLTDWDERYFSKIRRYDNKYDAQGLIVQCEDDHSSTHDLLFAKVIANEMLEKYLQSELSKVLTKSIEQNTDWTNQIKKKNNKILWTDSKCSLIELIYALHSAGAFNNSNVGINELMAYFEEGFEIDLGDYYRTYSEIKNRSSRTKFLDKLRLSLLARMDEDNEKQG